MLADLNNEIIKCSWGKIITSLMTYNPIFKDIHSNYLPEDTYEMFLDETVETMHAILVEHKVAQNVVFQRNLTALACFIVRTFVM